MYTPRCRHCGVELITPGGHFVPGLAWSHVTDDGDRRMCMGDGLWLGTWAEPEAMWWRRVMAQEETEIAGVDVNLPYGGDPLGVHRA